MVGIAANVLLAAFKALVGAMANSVAIVMDAVNNLTDALSSVITVIGTKLSAQPADREHPFGHGRIEYFSAIIIAAIVLSAGVSSLIESVKKMFHPTEPDYTRQTLVVIVVAIVVKLLLGRYVKRQGELLHSDALVASGADALFDAIITFSTLVSALIMLWWHVSIDGLLGTFISLAIIKAGFEMLTSPVNELLGARFSPELVKSLRQEVLSEEGVRGVYDIILHNYGPNVVIGSLHVSVADTLSAYDVHGLTRRIAERVYERFGIILTIGIYAIATGEGRRSQIQQQVMQAVARHPEIVQAHGFYYFEAEHRLSVDIVPDISVTDEAVLASQLREELEAIFPEETISIVIDHNFSE